MFPGSRSESSAVVSGSHLAVSSAVRRSAPQGMTATLWAAALAWVLWTVGGSPAPWGDSNNVGVSSLDRIVFPADVQSPFSPKPAGSSREARARFLKAAEAIFGVAVRLKLFLHVSDKDNFVVSPVSVASAIGELLLGAKGRTREQLEWLLSTESNFTAADDDPLDLHRQLGGLVQHLETGEGRPDDGYVLNVASAFFVQPDLKMKPSYVHAVTQMYNLQFWPLDFSGDPKRAQAVVNKWSSDHTHGQITEALPGGLPSSTFTLLLNAVYFKGDWETPFDPELTVPGVFRSAPDRGVRVDFMRGQFDMLYAESEAMGCRMIALPYKHAQAAMFVVMPLKGRNEYNLQRFVASLTFHNVRDLVASAKSRSVTVVLPKMVLKDTLSIREAVTRVRDKLKEESAVSPAPPKTQRRRIVRSDDQSRYQWRYNFRHQYYFSIPSRIGDTSATAVGGSASEEENPQHETPHTTPVEDSEKLNLDMSGASADLRFRVDDVLHQVVVEVSEKGTEAAAISTGTVDYIGDVKLFKVDSPFMFFVRHELTLASLFWGIVTDPTNGVGEYV